MQIHKYLIFFLTFIAIFLAILISQVPDSNLHIIACDVGQGDAILIVHKNVQILTDGGPSNKVINCLSKYLPFWDRHLNLVVSTHPDSDHSTGLVEVIKRYKVDSILINPIDSGTQTIGVLEKTVGGKGVSVITPNTHQSIRLGLIYLDILNPTAEQIKKLTIKVNGSYLGFFEPVDQTNEYSITYKLSFGDFYALFTGDIGQASSERIANTIPVQRVNYIKIPHHGSKNGLTESLLSFTAPQVAVISVGKNNYGHPSQSVLEMLDKYKVKTLRTDKLGDIEMITDGKAFWLKD